MRNRGFTLAEVLITLGIIGVVAAMTIPTLIANTNSQKFRAQFKKTISTLNQAARMSIAQFDVDFAGVKALCGENPATETAEKDATICGIFNTTLAGATLLEDPMTNYEINDNSENPILDQGSDWLGYQMADGAMFIFAQQDKYCTKEDPCFGFIDVNGKTLPNKQVHGEEITSFNNVFGSPAYALPGGMCFKICPPGQILDFEACKCNARPTLGANPYRVPNDANHMTDIYPVNFYEHVVMPATRAGQYVLNTSK